MIIAKTIHQKQSNRPQSNLFVLTLRRMIRDNGTPFGSSVLNYLIVVGAPRMQPEVRA